MSKVMALVGFAGFLFCTICYAQPEPSPVPPSAQEDLFWAFEENLNIQKNLMELGESANPGCSPDIVPLTAFRKKAFLRALKRGADINKKYDKQTLLGICLMYGHPDFVSLLLKNGANPNITDSDEDGERSPLVTAVLYGDLGDAKTKNQKLFFVRKLLSAGADPNLARDCDTPLWYAVSHANEPPTNEDLEVIKVLAKASPKSIDLKGCGTRKEEPSPFEFATRNKSQKILEILKSAQPSKIEPKSNSAFVKKKG